MYKEINPKKPDLITFKTNNLSDGLDSLVFKTA